ncbi:MAG: hypothetical protein KW802_02030 [Candidatus Doudnabacteria bacterium]|nr:hypothetical protein [Candidatus Doudnabacteria bacterium]
MGRHAPPKVLARYLFTPPNTPENEAPQEPPQEYTAKLSEAMRPENLELAVIPCGTILYGMSNGTRIMTENGQTVLEVNVEGDPLALGWAEPGVKTPDGKPGVRVWRPKDALKIEYQNSPFCDQTVRPYVIVWCGNVSFELAPFQYTENVSAPLLDTPKTEKPAEQSRIDLTKPPPIPDTPEATTPLIPTTSKHKWPCTGKVSRWVCTGLGVTGASFFFRGGDQASVPPPVVKSGSPGGR